MRTSSRLLSIVAALFTVTLAHAAPPNILWLTCEDLSPRLGCYGDQTAPTPNIDRLAEQGVRYTRAFTATGVCAPCRHTIITGLYPMQSGAQYMRTTSRSSAVDEIVDPVLREQALSRLLYEATPPEGVRCFTEFLRKVGYYCTNNSKEDYQFTTPVTAWDDSSRQAHYRNRATGQPFFAVFNQTITHESGVHGDFRSPRKIDPADVPVPRFLPDTPIVRLDLARHYDNVLRLDAWIGEKLDELERAGLVDSTIVFFFSDHGDGLPRHKRWAYDSGTRVPLIIRWPDGRRAGEVEQRLMSFVDLAPTTLRLAGVEPPEYLPGRVFAGPSRDPAPRCVFTHRDRMDDTAFDTIRSARGDRYRYVRNYRPELPYLQLISYRDRAAAMGEIYRLRDAGQLTPAQWQWSASTKPREELYDTRNDPDEVVNLVDDPAHAEKLAELRSELDAWINRIDDPLDADEALVVRQHVWPPNGIQPATAPPLVVPERLPTGSYRVTIECDTASASIGYRQGENEAWTIYTAPFVTDAESLEIVAHRIGWKPSRSRQTLALNVNAANE